MDELVEIRDMCKIYNPGENEVRALDHVSLQINRNEFVAIIGTSGSGKSTLLHSIAGVDMPTSGKIYLDGQAMCRSYMTLESFLDQLDAMDETRERFLMLQFPRLLPRLRGKSGKGHSGRFGHGFLKRQFENSHQPLPPQADADHLCRLCFARTRRHL